MQGQNQIHVSQIIQQESDDHFQEEEHNREESSVSVGGPEGVLALLQGGADQPVLQVVEGEGGGHVIHVTEEQLAQLHAHAQFADSN